MTTAEHAKTEAFQIDFFQRCYERFLNATATAGELRRCYRVAGTTVQLVFAGETLVPYIAPALEHLRIPDVDHLPDLTLCIWDSETTSIGMAPPPCREESFTARGDIWGFTSSRIKTAFHWIEYSVNLMDHSARTGIYWVQRAATLPYWVHAAPLRTLFHWWMEKNGCQLLHGAAVGTDDGAVLLAGKGGIGNPRPPCPACSRGSVTLPTITSLSGWSRSRSSTAYTAPRGSRRTTPSSFPTSPSESRVSEASARAKRSCSSIPNSKTKSSPHCR